MSERPQRTFDDKEYSCFLPFCCKSLFNLPPGSQCSGMIHKEDARALQFPDGAMGIVVSWHYTSHFLVIPVFSSVCVGDYCLFTESLKFLPSGFGKTAFDRDRNVNEIFTGPLCCFLCCHMFKHLEAQVMRFMASEVIGLVPLTLTCCLKS